eukprot:765292-Hanusia_phi.AAC.3
MVPGIQLPQVHQLPLKACRRFCRLQRSEEGRDALLAKRWAALRVTKVEQNLGTGGREEKFVGGPAEAGNDLWSDAREVVDISCVVRVVSQHQVSRLPRDGSHGLYPSLQLLASGQLAQVESCGAVEQERSAEREVQLAQGQRMDADDHVDARHLFVTSVGLKELLSDPSAASAASAARTRGIKLNDLLKSFRRQDLEVTSTRPAKVAVRRQALVNHFHPQGTQDPLDVSDGPDMQRYTPSLAPPDASPVISLRFGLARLRMRGTMIGRLLHTSGVQVHRSCETCGSQGRQIQGCMWSRGQKGRGAHRCSSTRTAASGYM